MSMLVLIVFFSFSSFVSIVLYGFYLLFKTYNLNIERSQKQKEEISHGLLVASLTFAWYAVSISFTMYNKWLMGQFLGGFKFPIISTTIHMFVKLLFSRIWFYGYAGRDNVTDVSFRYLYVAVILIGVCTAGDVAMSNASFLFISLTLYTVLKTLVLVSTFAWGIALGLESFDCKTFFAVLMISGGVSVSVFSADKFSLIGVLLCIGASCLGGLRWALLQLLMKEDSQSSSDVFVTLYRFSPYSAMSILPLALFMEGPKLEKTKFGSNPIMLSEGLCLATAGGLISFILIIVEVKLVRVTSSLTMGVLGQVKEVTQIALSMVMFKDHLSTRGAVGIFVSLCAAQLYRYVNYLLATVTYLSCIDPCVDD